jgi:hypothetical protein
MQLLEQIEEKFLTHLQGLGTRDPYWVRVTLDRAVKETLDSAGSEEFSAEYREFLTDRIRVASRSSMLRAVEEDEFEWAQGLFNLTRL